ncbi:DUF533 domain-containing protein [Rubellimicrobium arenae]|uniref:DUF533 domain-containing protein n=1 Tax=Rubellimicrobium arenae TaxID=2817372 RepID=UPI001B305DB6|nr:DUF533 domain-containing protein [Rubellimicrobium arenae]
MESLAQEAAAPSRGHVGVEPGRALEVALGTKLLDGWLANRHQILVPHTLNFQALSSDEGHLLLRIMAAAAQADGQVDLRESRQIQLALQRVGAGAAEAEWLDTALGELQNLAALLAEVQRMGLATHAYAAALLAINRRGPANQAFLTYMAARLGLAADVAGSLDRRYRS